MKPQLYATLASLAHTLAPFLQRVAQGAQGYLHPHPHTKAGPTGARAVARAKSKRMAGKRYSK